MGVAHGDDELMASASGQRGSAGAGVREARVLPQHARKYVDVVADHWYPAAVLADYVRGTYHRASRAVRELDEAHFEFRGGSPRGEAWHPTRRVDGPRNRRPT